MFQTEGKAHVKPLRKEKSCTFKDLVKVKHHWKEDKEKRQSAKREGRNNR